MKLATKAPSFLPGLILGAVFARALEAQGAPPIVVTNHDVHWACNSDRVFQGGNFACEEPSGQNAIVGIHRGWSVSEDADLIPEPEGQPILHELIFGSGTGILTPDPNFEDDNRDYAGTAIVVAGSALASGPHCQDDAAAGYRFVSKEWGDLFGWSVTAIGDIGGDGRDDFLIGAPRGPFDQEGLAT